MRSRLASASTCCSSAVDDDGVTSTGSGSRSLRSRIHHPARDLHIGRDVAMLGRRNAANRQYVPRTLERHPRGRIFHELEHPARGSHAASGEIASGFAINERLPFWSVDCAIEGGSVDTDDAGSFGLGLSFACCDLRRRCRPSPSMSSTSAMPSTTSSTMEARCRRPSCRSSTSPATISPLRWTSFPAKPRRGRRRSHSSSPTSSSI